MSAYKGSTGTSMGFDRSCRHRWGSWEIGRTQKWRECTKCDQVDSEDRATGAEVPCSEHSRGLIQTDQPPFIGDNRKGNP